MTRYSSQHPSAPAAALVLLICVLGGCAFLAREATRAFMNVNELFSARDIEIQINKSFLEKYKDRVSIATTFTVDQAMQNPAARIFDGDLHMAGQAPEIGLPAVAEIANGASAKKAADLVHSVEGTGKPKTVSIVTRKGLYNDVEFLMEISDERQIVVPGGRFVIASARDMKGDLLVKRLRMVFASGTPPEKAVKLLKRGDRLHVYGLPRVDFAEVSRRMRGSHKDPALLVKPLPYEIIIQGVYKDAK
jgi:hypothetical protein